MMQRRKFLPLWVLLWAVAMGAQAQTYRVQLQLQDSATREVVPYVNSVLLRAADSAFAYGAVSGDDGQVLFPQVDSGSYLLRVSAIGYRTLWRPLRVQGPVVLGRVLLQPGAALLEAVTVTAERPLYAVDGEKTLYHVADDPAVQRGTAGDALQNAPGVEVDIEGNVTLRGVSSVEIWINDKPSHMSTEALKQYIKQLPAGAIDRIEVITNPSARYSTAGGVINIITVTRVKRNELLCLGTHGSTQPGFYPWASYVYANERFNMNVFLSAYTLTSKQNGSGSSTMYGQDSLPVQHDVYTNRMRSNHRGGYAGLNLSYEVDTATTLSAWLGLYPDRDHSTAGSSYVRNVYRPVAADFSFATADTMQSLWGSGGGYGGLWIEHRFDTAGRKLSANVSGDFWSNKEDAVSWRQYAYQPQADVTRRWQDRDRSASGSAEVTYVQPLGRHTELEMGAELARSSSQLNRQADTLVPTTAYTFAPEAIRSYDARYGSTSVNGFVTAQHRIEHLTLKAGLRAEHTRLRATFPDHAEWDLAQPYTRWVPSLHLSYSTPSMHTFSLSYTLRHALPQAEQVTLFTRYEDDSYTTGNPALRPAHTHNLQAAWTKYFQNFGSVGIEAYYRANTDAIEVLTDVAYSPYHDRMVPYAIPFNTGSSHAEGVEANITYRPREMMNLRLNATLYNSHYRAQFRPGEWTEDGALAYRLRLNVWAKLWEVAEVFGTASYRSRTIGLLSTSEANTTVDLGVSTDLLQHKLSAFVYVGDLFNSARTRGTTTNPYYLSESNRKTNSRFLSFGITLRFGKLELENLARQGGGAGH